jgi:hypothetical protein
MKLLDYLDKNYFGPAAPADGEAWKVENAQKGWMLSYRQGVSYAAIDTNNYIESWHNTLKRRFLRNKQRRRVDTVIYVLYAIAVPHYQQICMQTSAGIGRRTPAQIEEDELKKKAMDYLETRPRMGLSGDPITRVSETVLKVESMEHLGNKCDEVTIDFSISPLGYITDCTCKDYFMYQTVCEHIALTQAALPSLTYAREEQWTYPYEVDAFTMDTAQDQAATEEEEEVRVDYNVVPKLNMVDILLKRVMDLNDMRDKSQPWMHEAYVIEHLQRILNHVEADLPVAPGEGLNYKPQAQWARKDSNKKRKL